MNSYLVQSFRDAGIHAFKIPDNAGFAQRFSPEKPYDICVIDKLHTLAIEGKIIKPKAKTKIYAPFHFSDIRGHQLRALTDVTINTVNALGIIALYVWKPRKISRVHFIPITYIHKLIDEGRQSMSAEEVEKIQPYIDLKKGRFGMTSNYGDYLYLMKNGAY